jgi:hypothetical protein
MEAVLPVLSVVEFSFFDCGKLPVSSSRIFLVNHLKDDIFSILYRITENSVFSLLDVIN